MDLSLRRLWAYIVIAFLLVVIAYMYFNRNVCPIEKVPIKSEEGYEPIKQSDNVPRDNSKGELVLYYASWCGYSKQFLPIWEKFVNEVAPNIQGLNIKTVQCEGGEERACFEKGVEGYPTVILYPKNNTEVLFEGDRTVHDLEEFVSKHL